MATYDTLTINGAFDSPEWLAADKFNDSFTNAPDFVGYGRKTSTAYVFGFQASGSNSFGAGTTFWLNTDMARSTGLQVFGFAAGAEYAVSIDAAGAATLTHYLSNGAIDAAFGSVVLDAARSADGKTLEFAVNASSLGGIAGPLELFGLLNNSVPVPGDFSGVAYQLRSGTTAALKGDVTLDGALGDWTADQRIDTGASVAGYEVYGKSVGDSFAFALKSAIAIGPNTTIWVDSNPTGDASTGYRIFGASDGVEYAIEFGANGQPSLSSVNAAGVLTAVANADVQYGFNAERTQLEVSFLKSAIGAPQTIKTLIDINNNASAYLPGAYVPGAGYRVLDTASLPARTDFTKTVAIVYSETSASKYFSTTAYSQLFMNAQSQAAAAGVSYDVISEADLKDLAKLVNYDAIVFPSFANVKAADVSAISNNLSILEQYYKTGIVAAGNFMTNDESGAALAGDSYARMKSLLGVTLEQFGQGAVTLQAGDLAQTTMMEGYTANETIRTYTNAATGWLDFAPTGAGITTVKNISNGAAYDAAIATSGVGGGRNVHFATEGFSADSNLLQNAIEWSVYGQGVRAGLQMSRNESIVASRNDMDQSQYLEDVAPYDANGNRIPGIYDKLIPILEQWKADFNFVGSYYLVNGAYPETDNGIPVGEQTNWAVSKPYYDALLAMGNELGSHSYTHPSNTNLLFPDVITQDLFNERVAQYQQLLQTTQICYCPYCLRADVDPAVRDALSTKSVAEINQILASALTAPDPTALDAVSKAILESSYKFQFASSRHNLEQNLGVPIIGAAVPGAGETLDTATQIIQYFEYMTGGGSLVGAGYPGAFGYLTPGLADKVYIAPNTSFDFTLIGFQGKTPAEAEAAWAAEVAGIKAHADVPIVVWPWHDYGPTQWIIDPPAGSPYNLEMFTNFIKAAFQSGAEFVTLADLAQRIESFEKSGVVFSQTSNQLTATVASTDAGKFALDLDGLGNQVIASVNGWYAYDEDSVFTDRDGGTFAINLGATQADVTHITKLPMRAELLSVSGDGKSIDFTVIGEGEVVIDLAALNGGGLTVTGADIVSLAGEILTLDLSPNLLVNGSFESPSISAGNVVMVSTATLAGWKNAGDSVIEFWRGYSGINATNGMNYIELDANLGLDGIYQNLNTSASTYYEISLDVRARIGNTDSVEVYWGGVKVGQIDPTLAWANYTFTVKGVGADTRLELRELSTQNTSLGALIDNVQVEAIGSAQRTVSVQVTGPNQPPVITSNGGGATAAISVAENVNAVTTVTATDPDAGQTITYAITGGADAAKFAINATTGALTFITAPNFETRTDVGANNVYDVIVTAKDNLSAADTQAVAVTVTDVNEAPVITSNGGGATAAISVAENGAAVTTVTATDPDAGQTITYSITGGADAAKFTINTSTGALSFLAAPDFEAPTDAGANNVYDLIVTAKDNLNAIDTQNIAVTVTNVNGVNLIGSAADNTLTGGAENDTIAGGSGNDNLSGLGSNDTLRGDSGNDTVNGGDGNDTISGGTGNDSLIGGAGNDRIIGEAGVDTMTGGDGADVFVFTANGDMGTGSTSRDVITDFRQGLDKIDLSAIDANQGVFLGLFGQAGDQAFTLLTTAGANFTALGQLKYSYTTINGVQRTIIEGNDVGGNGADFAIDLVGRYTLTASDFIL